MNNDQVTGKAKSFAGTLQRLAGRLVGSRPQQLKGLAKQIAGNLQAYLGDIRQSERNPRKRLSH